MAGDPRQKNKRSEPTSRKDRLKSALKANLAKRKAQARVRNAKPDDQTSGRKED
ncbi:hypothetical protein [Qingshengfaniella alkalisoli]|uniref:hypothetical protein n=1 Tax=Qingshengfaniella alkalisoli TaxID=2599296 RepID=UPI00143D9A09|nr:hypothetical protein [Qingshengfaniella alkalisoli]